MNSVLLVLKSAQGKDVNLTNLGHQTKNCPNNRVNSTNNLKNVILIQLICGIKLLQPFLNI